MYSAKLDKCKVYHYYLSKLVQNPVLDVNLAKLGRLWEELQSTFMTTYDDLVKQHYIIKAILLLYSQYYPYI